MKAPNRRWKWDPTSHHFKENPNETQLLSSFVFNFWRETFMELLVRLLSLLFKSLNFYFQSPTHSSKKISYVFSLNFGICYYEEHSQ
jgi:hypothetical protein